MSTYDRLVDIDNFNGGLVKQLRETDKAIRRLTELPLREGASLSMFELPSTLRQSAGRLENHADAYIDFDMARRKVLEEGAHGNPVLESSLRGDVTVKAVLERMEKDRRSFYLRGDVGRNIAVNQMTKILGEDCYLDYFNEGNFWGSDTGRVVSKTLVCGGVGAGVDLASFRSGALTALLTALGVVGSSLEVYHERKQWGHYRDEVFDRAEYVDQTIEKVF